MVAPVERTNTEFAKIILQSAEPTLASALDLEFVPLRDRCGIPSLIALDFLLLASVIYAVDKSVPRESAADCWTRDIELSIPVSDPALWGQVKALLEQCVSFLTGDKWQLEFVQLTHKLNRPRPRKRHRYKYVRHVQAHAVCLFSGGLDSLIGAIDLLEEHPNENLLLVGHHDGDISGPMSDQMKLNAILRSEYPRRTDILQIRVGQNPSGEESTYRSRSLLFLALGIYAAQGIGGNIPVYIPENGTIALNVPLTPSRRGSCSTRTAHPDFLRMLQNVLANLGIVNLIINPYQFKTKGECAYECRNRAVFQKAAFDAVSCAKRGRRSSWINKDVEECGRCMPCIYRRAALHHVNMDMQKYGQDICLGEVDLDENNVSANDFRACLSFLHRRLSPHEIALLLLANGNLELERLPQYADTVARAMDEIRKLLRDKATDTIKQRARL